MRGTVLILDDDAAVLELTAFYLNKNGFQTLTSTSAASAVERFDEARGTVRILIADLVLPSGSGVDVAVRLKARAPALKTLFVSGYALEEWRHEDAALFQRLPGDSFRFLRKPYSGNELIARLVELSDELPAAAEENPADGNEPDDAPHATVLYEALTRQAGLLELAHDAIIVRTLAGHVRYWNHGAEILYGWTKEQVAGRKAHELLRTIFPEPFEHIAHALHETRRWEGELHHTRRDGSTVIVSSRWAVRDAEHNQMEILEINRDISAQKRVEDGFRTINQELQARIEELHRAEQMFRSLLESAPDAMVIVDNSDQIVLVNAQTERLFGYMRDELIGQSVDLLLPDRFRGRHANHRAGFARTPHVRPMGEGLELVGMHKNGEEILVEISLSPIEAGSGWLCSGAIRQVAGRRRLEK